MTPNKASAANASNIPISMPKTHVRNVFLRAPQWGHESALELTDFPHSRQRRNAIIL